jgi:2-hydroxychromene-2-carboxylate isomerase
MIFIMTLSIDLFWSFRSPYSYLALPRLLDLQAKWDLVFVVRPVYPLAIRQPDFFEREQSGWMHYLLTDVIRLSQYLDIPIASPNPDPILIDPETGRAAKDQPHIHRLTHLGIAAAEAGYGLKFLDIISTQIWSGNDWTQDGFFHSALTRQGIDLGDLDQTITSRPTHYETLATHNAEALVAGGHWGVPTMVYDNEPFFGQDRIELLLWRLKQNGLQPRQKTV